jgi:hypothetical protein
MERGMSKPMLRVVWFSAAGLLVACASQTERSQVQAQVPQRVQHVAIIWLKPPGDQGAKLRYIEASKQIAHLPGVLSYRIGVPAIIKSRWASKALDESYDLALSSEFESQQAYEAFLQNPDYIRLARDILKPMVEKYRVYDFVVPERLCAPDD